MFINNLEVKIFEKNRRKLKKIEKEIYAVQEGSKYRSESERLEPLHSESDTRYYLQYKPN